MALGATRRANARARTTASPSPVVRRAGERRVPGARRVGDVGFFGREARAFANLEIFGKFSAKCRSFSAVSAPIFASKYAFFSIFQNLPDYLAEKFENWQKFADFATSAKFTEFSQKLLIFQTDFLRKF